MEVHFVNEGDTPAVLVLADDAHLVVQDAYGSTLYPIDAWSGGWGMTTCSPAPVGEVSPRNSMGDLAQVSLAPGGTLTERLQWHAGTPERAHPTCGWDYNPLPPGVYRLSVDTPLRTNAVSVQVTAAGPCRATCAAPPGSLALPFTKYPKLARVGESVRVHEPRYVDPVCGKGELLLGHAISGIVAVSGLCTDWCCPAEFDGVGFECPWCKRVPLHRGDPVDLVDYALDGRAVGPVSAPSLPRLEVCEDECGAVVKLPAQPPRR